MNTIEIRSRVRSLTIDYEILEDEYKTMTDEISSCESVSAVTTYVELCNIVGDKMQRLGCEVASLEAILKAMGPNNEA